MKKNQLKNALKPLIQEALREVIAEDRQFIQRCIMQAVLQEGTLTHIISECMQGVATSVPQVIHEIAPVPRAPSKKSQESSLKARKERARIKQEMLQEREERERKVMEASGLGHMFDGLKEEILEEDGYIEVEETFEDEYEEFEAPEPQARVLKEEWAPKSSTDRKIKKLERGVPGALKDIPANNPGININRIQALVGDRWKKSMANE